jgi:hypothetical protein
MPNKVKADPEMAKKIDDCLLVVAGLLLEKDGKMALDGTQIYDIGGYQVKLTARVVSIPYPSLE